MCSICHGKMHLLENMGKLLYTAVVDTAQVLDIMIFLLNKSIQNDSYYRRDGSSLVVDVTTKKESMRFLRPYIEIIFLAEWSYFIYINDFYYHLKVERAPLMS